MKSQVLSFFLLLIAGGAFAQADLRVSYVSPGQYFRPGTYNFIPGIENKGAKGGNFRLWWQIDNGPVQNALPTMPSGVLANAPITRFESNAFTFTLTTPGISKLKIWTTLTTPGVTESNPANDTLIQMIKVMPELPEKHVILEVYKHQICGPCYPAAVYNHQVVEPMKNYSLVYLYTSPTDVLYNADAAMINNVYNFAHPAPMFDRYRFKYFSDIMTGYYTQDTTYQLRELGRRELQYEPVEVGVQYMSMDTTARTLKVRLRAKAYDTVSGDLRFNLWITEDSVKAYQAEAPDPNNYWHSHVLRSFVGGPWGKAGSLPAKLAAGQTYTCDFTYNIPQGYKFRHLKALGVVQMYHKDSMARRILNSAEVQATKKLGVAQRNIVEDVTAYPVPARNQLQLRINDAVALQDMKLSIRTISGQLIREQQVLDHEQSISLQGLPAGQYIWSLQGPESEASKVFTKVE